MAEVTTIEWTNEYLKTPVLWKGELTTVIPGATFNPWWGCMKVSRACKHCYAETFANRFAPGLWGPSSVRKKFDAKHWNQPLKWNEECKKLGITRKVFCGSMCDWAEDNDQINAERIKLFELIEATPHLTWLLLTKRPELILQWIPPSWKSIPPANVWYGATVEDDKNIWRIDELIKVPATKRFISCEPLDTHISIIKYLRKPYQKLSDPVFAYKDKHGISGVIHWVICGGESGSKAEPLNPRNVKYLLGECIQTKTPFFFKQWGEWMPVLDDLMSPTMEFKRMGKSKSGRLIMGREYNEMPN